MGLKPGNDLAMPLRLARHFRTSRPDVVHTRNAEAFYYGFAGARLAGVPVIVHSEHGRPLPDKPHRMWLQRQLLRHTDAVFSVSEQLKQDLVTHLGVDAAKVEVLYNGVDLDRFGDGDRAGARRALELGTDELVIGSVGRLVPVKNYPLLLRAVATLPPPGATVLLIGDGPDHASLRALATTLGISSRVRFLGHREDVQHLLAAMDVFVLPSVSEGMSNTLLEAMAVGAAAVASDVGGNREIIRAGIDGLLFESGELEQLRCTLLSLAQDAKMRSDLARTGRERVRSVFGIDAMIARYEALYERLAGAAGTNP